MYMYYLLGWKLNKKYFEMYKQKDVHLPSIEEQLKVSMITQKELHNSFIM